MGAAEPRRVELPANINVECPQVGRRLRAVGACNGCEHYVGLRERFADDKLAFAQRYQVGCRFPFARGLFEVVSEETEEQPE